MTTKHINIILLTFITALLITTTTASANTGDLIQINDTHWYFETTQTDLTDGTYNYQAFANDVESDYRVLTVQAPPQILLDSSSPAIIYTNYTGIVTLSYIVTHQTPLNYSSLALLYGTNYTPTGDMHNYLSVPYNSISYEGLYRAPNRNKTPYLSWEFNTTITGDNVWQWGGGDNDSPWITKSPIDSTHTYINITGITHHIFPSSNYIAKLPLYESPKTQFEINRAQGIIIKVWDVEQFRNRNNEYFINMLFDSDIESTYPTEDIDGYFLPSTFNLLTDDPLTEGTYLGSWNSTRWMNHTWVPHTNASYADPLIINASLITPTNNYYIYLTSGTVSSKSYVLNATNYDPGICNITFAETNSMWVRNELAGTTSAVAYTPSFFTTFTRNSLQMESQLYIADTNDLWANSGIDIMPIGVSNVPVTAVSFRYFNKSCVVSGYVLDSGMDGTYDDGAINVGLNCPADPDGGSVSHNLTLHYANETIVAIINDTFITTGLEQLEINFITSPYYSLTELYTLKCVSEDGEGSIVTRWLDKNFTLAADGTTGWVEDTRVLFWGMNNIPTLYTTVNDNSLISYNAGTDIYTMHVPFFKSKANDTFYFNETVHLESLNNEDVAYFRMLGTTIFDYAYIYGWNTASNTAAPTTDTYRSYVYSCCESVGNITNSEMSYLGSDLYQQEGLNFISNTRDYLIYNSTFSHNAEGPILEDSNDMTFSECTITNNINVGIGVYHSDNIIISNCTIDSNGGRGISIYNGSNHTVEYNTITNSGASGIQMWSYSVNNTCTENSVSGSTLYDYYVSSSSTDNSIIDPASTTNRIRSTSTSDIKIENTDNAVFSHNSLNTSYAYLTNFSMYISGVSQTVDITQRDMTIVPSNDNLSIENLEWSKIVTFNAASDIGVNQTWFNITNTKWNDKNITVFLNNVEFAIESADSNGTIAYNYSVVLTSKLFTFKFVVPPPNMPLSIFISLGVMLFVLCGASFYLVGISSIFTSMLSVMIAFIMSKTSINGTLVQNIGGVSDAGNVVQGTTIIQIPALAYILMFVGLIMIVILIIQVLREIEWRKSKDTVELDI